MSETLELLLKRVVRKPKATFGDLYVDTVYECHTIEDVVRDIDEDGTGKIPHETAIPAGRYKVIINLSPKFGKRMPRLLNVPHFDGILIHPGNSSEDTWGCIIVGTLIAGDDFLAQSTVAFQKLFPKLDIAQSLGKEIWITIENAW
jgi:hypothetical protein